MAGHGKILGFVHYDLSPPTPMRVRGTFWNADSGRFLVPALFGAGWTVNLRSASRHPFQAVLLAALILWRLCAGRKG